MTFGQRKAHKHIWLVLTPIISLFLVFAIHGLSFSDGPIPAQKEQVVVQRKSSEIKIQLNAPFKSSSSVVYGLTMDGKRGELLGQMNGVGSYTFQSAQNIKGILVIDEIKGQEIYKSEF